MLDFIRAKNDGGGIDNWSRKNLVQSSKSNRHHQQTNIQQFTGTMPFLPCNQQCQSNDGKK